MVWLQRIGMLAIMLIGSGCAVPIVSEREAEIEGTELFEAYKKETPAVRDASTLSYVNCVSRAILAEIDPPYDSLDWEIAVLDTEDVQALAFPGGKIIVFRGLLNVAGDQDQLAAVIGHEVAHVTKRHSVERMNKAITTQSAVYVGTIAMGGGQTAYDLTSMAAQYGLLLPYSRGNETEADVVGQHYMANAGFDPRASVELWKNMSSSKGAAPPEFLSTHPSSSTRITNLIAQLPETLDEFNEARAAGKRPACRR